MEIDREELKGITFQEEQDLIREQIADEKFLKAPAIIFVTHAILMNNLKEWASVNDIYFVDVIPVMDQERDSLVTHVHLDANGNRVVAQKLAQKISSL